MGCSGAKEIMERTGRKRGESACIYQCVLNSDRPVFLDANTEYTVPR